MPSLFKTISVVISLLVLLGCHNKLKQPSIELNELTISQIHQAYKTGRYNSQQLVKAYIQQINRYDGKLNAITIINTNALSSAKQLDEEYKKTGVLRPLHGIPVLVKDNINTIGLPTTGGSLALESFIPKSDAFVINRLLDAGAIILAKTNMAEWAFSAKHTESSTKGSTYNAYDQKYVPAGSSGGTAAGIATNFAVIGLGTDTGNSIRGPSSHNALVGFRTTLGLISREGIIPLILRNDVVGPMSRTVEDATRLIEIMAGYDANDQLTEYSNGKIPGNYQQFLQKDGLKGARIGVLRELILEDADPEVMQLFETAIADIKRLGASVIDEVTIPHFADLAKNQWCVDFRQDVEDYLITYVKDDALSTVEDIIKIGTKSEYAKKQLTFFAANSGRMGDVKTACSDAFNDSLRLAFRNAIEKEMDRLKLDALIYPTWSNPPARIVAFEEEYKGDNSQIIAPHTGQPAFTVPMGFTHGNLPAGLQFLGRMFDEPGLIKLTYAYEQGTHHRKPPAK